MGKYDNDQSTGSPNGRIIFTTSRVDEFMRSHGANILWETAIFSPDRASTGQPRQGGIDGGTGIIYKEPVETWALIQAMTRNVQNTMIGLNTAGTALLTTKRQDRMAPRDRITFKDQSIPEKLLIKISPQDITHGVNLRYNVKSVEDVLMPMDDGSFDFVSPDSLNIDYDKNIYWPDKSLVGKYVSMNIMAELRFYVVDISREARYQYENDVDQADENRDMTNQPRLMVVRREDMYIPDVISNQDDNIVTTDESLEPQVDVDPDIDKFFRR